MEFNIEFNIIWSVHREQVVHNAQVDFTKKRKKEKGKKKCKLCDKLPYCPHNCFSSWLTFIHQNKLIGCN